MSEPILICLLAWTEAGSWANSGLAAAAVAAVVGLLVAEPVLAGFLLLPQPAASRPAAAVAAMRCLAVRRIAVPPVGVADGRRDAPLGSRLRQTTSPFQVGCKFPGARCTHKQRRARRQTNAEEQGEERARAA